MKTRIVIATGLTAAVVASLPGSALASNGFQGSCEFAGVVRDEGATKSVMRGACTGSLNGAEYDTYAVKVVVRAAGMSVGPLPLLTGGTGRTEFIDEGVRFGFQIDQVGTAFTLRGAGGTRGYGFVVPRHDGGYTSHVEFPSEFRG